MSFSWSFSSLHRPRLNPRYPRIVLAFILVVIYDLNNIFALYLLNSSKHLLSLLIVIEIIQLSIIIHCVSSIAKTEEQTERETRYQITLHFLGMLIHRFYVLRENPRIWRVPWSYKNVNQASWSYALCIDDCHQMKIRPIKTKSLSQSSRAR